MEEIDWKERHFQICLAILSCSESNMHSRNFFKRTIDLADEMVELLKEHAAEKEQPQPTVVHSTPDAVDNVKEEKDNKRCIPKRGLWSPLMRRSELFGEIWGALEGLGYKKGDDIPYFHFNECCEELNIELEEAEVDKFAEIFDVNIG